MHADGVDWMLMGLGLIGAVGEGFITPIIFFITGLLLNDIGGSFIDGTFMTAISEVLSFLFFLLILFWFWSLHDKADQIRSDT